MPTTPTSSRWRLVPRLASVLALLGLAAHAGSEPRSPAPKPDAPAYTNDGKLIRPDDYREWVFVTSGLGMTYGPAKTAEGQPPRFDNVFVTRPAYRAFRKSGTWPDQTMFILEVRRGETQVSINNGGRTQGERVALEAAVKDRQRYPEGGWAYFSFDGPEVPIDAAEPLPPSATCYSCHKAHAALDNTFVQFYPTLLDIAKRHGTVRPDEDPKPPASPR